MEVVASSVMLWLCHLTLVGVLMHLVASGVATSFKWWCLNAKCGIVSNVVALWRRQLCELVATTV